MASGILFASDLLFLARKSARHCDEKFINFELNYIFSPGLKKKIFKKKINFKNYKITLKLGQRAISL